jgi:hypothetical protein
MTSAVRYLQVPPGEACLPDLGRIRPFRAVVLVREIVSSDWRNRVSDWLVAAGCLYMLAWGHECSVWDDAVDWANIGAFDFKPIPPERFVMTTWHEDETMEEVFWFAKNCAEHPTTPLDHNLILDIASVAREAHTMDTWTATVTADS